MGMTRRSDQLIYQRNGLDALIAEAATGGGMTTHARVKGIASSPVFKSL